MKGIVDTAVFASAAQHDIISDSIVIDAYEVPLTSNRLRELLSLLTRLIKSRKIISIVVTSREAEVLWKQLLPVQAECCCQTWYQKGTCKYRLQHIIPLSLEHGQNPICCCGECEDIDGFPRFQDWEVFAKYATRIAIMTLLAVPYVEAFLTEAMKHEIGQIRVGNRELTDSEKYANCGNAEKKLKKCTRCGKVSYYNHPCQKRTGRSIRRSIRMVKEKDEPHSLAY